MILKEIAHKVAQAFRLAQATDKKLSTGIAAALDAKAEQLREYEKRFEPEPPEPDPLLEARTSLAQVGFSAAAMVYFTSYGDRYHIRKECSKLKRNVRAVRRSKAGNLSPCSKCGGGE